MCVCMYKRTIIIIMTKIIIRDFLRALQAPLSLRLVMSIDYCMENDKIITSFSNALYFVTNFFSSKNISTEDETPFTEALDCSS